MKKMHLKFTFAFQADKVLMYNILNYNHPIYSTVTPAFFIHQANRNRVTFQTIYALTFMCYQGIWTPELGLLWSVKARVFAQPCSFWRARWIMAWCSMFRRALMHISRPQGVKTTVFTLNKKLKYAIMSRHSKVGLNFLPCEHKSS
jgi:hypothetical protein